ncbi:MAG TPA: hypothetical protein PKD59_04615 [Miltoncostaeaceae bacterium]|nr:hypothetical protein [Miltoncostaeaceae bacterium]
MSPATLAATTAAAPATVWIPCGTCWGQRRILADHNGEGLVPHACPSCLGTGEQLVMTGGQV